MKVNVDGINTSVLWIIRSIPTIVIFKDGKPVETLIGARSKEQLIDEIEKLK